MSRRKPSALVAAFAATVVAIVLLLGGLVALVVSGGEEDGGQGTGSQTPAAGEDADSADSADSAERPDTPGTDARQPVSGAVRSLPSGLACSDLHERGLDYDTLVEYWRVQEQPAQIDVDKRGVPCESLYPDDDVASVWGTYDEPSVAFRAGLFCRDLHALDATYADAVAYWFAAGAPDRMDADLNGIPCETVYPPADVAAYWGDYAVPSIPSESGLYCRDLVAAGVSYSDTVAYWFAEGAPDRMDADLNGVPCETVYPAREVDEYWHG